MGHVTCDMIANRVLHETEHSVARDLQVRQIRAEFDTVPAGLATAAKGQFRRGLPSLLRQQPTYQTAWLIRIQATRARAERRDGQRQEQHGVDASSPLLSTSSSSSLGLSFLLVPFSFLALLAAKTVDRADAGLAVEECSQQ
jgi:hypothetical protein